MTPAALDPTLSALAVSLGVGLLLGIERERNKGQGATRGAAGVRTFAIVSLLGTLAALSGSAVVLAIAGGGVAALIAIAHARASSDDPGITTEVALLATFVVGVLAATKPLLAAAAGVVLALLLVARGYLHRFASSTLNHRELEDAILLLAAALIVLPLLPDRPVDPWDAVNPRVVWRLTVIVMVVNAAGYVAQRAVGARYGLPLSGLLGGFVSSTAVVAAMGRRAREDEAALRPAVAAASLSNFASLVQLAIVLSAVDLSLLMALRAPLLAAGAVTIVAGLLFMRSALKSSEEAPAVSGRAFSVRTALLFAGLFCALTIVSVLAERFFGENGALIGAATGGFLDVHSTSAAVGAMISRDALTLELGAIGVALVMTTNTISKLAFARSGGRAFFLRLAPNLAAMVAAFWLGLLA
ncbi:MAG: DUF4010 domain-containing protein [Steroidobacteraceae bacterium]